MAYQKKTSVATLFTAVCLGIMGGTSLALSVVFCVNTQITHNSSQLNTVIVESSEAVQSISHAAEEIFGRMDSLNQAVQTQSTRIAGSSARIEQLVEHIESIGTAVTDLMPKRTEKR